MKWFRRKVDLPSVEQVESAPDAWLLYVWMNDGRSGMLDLSDWTGHLADRWREEGFDNWKVDAGMACWGEDRHFSPDLCSEELIEMPYASWLSMLSAVSAK